MAEGRVIVEGDYESLALGRNFNFTAEENVLKIKFWNELLFEAVNDGDFDAARFALDRGADAVARGEAELLPLHIAAHGGHLDIATLLLERGACIDATDDGGWTALHWAANKPMAALLLSRGAGVNAKNDSGETPLHRFAEAHDVASVVLLLERGALPYVQDVDGSTPLQVAEAVCDETDDRHRTIDVLSHCNVPPQCSTLLNA